MSQSSDSSRPRTVAELVAGWSEEEREALAPLIAEARAREEELERVSAETRRAIARIEEVSVHAKRQLQTLIELSDALQRTLASSPVLATGPRKPVN